MYSWLHTVSHAGEWQWSGRYLFALTLSIV